MKRRFPKWLNKPQAGRAFLPHDGHPCLEKDVYPIYNI